MVSPPSQSQPDAMIESELHALSYDIGWLLKNCNTERIKGCDVRDQTCASYVEAQRLLKILSTAESGQRLD